MAFTKTHLLFLIILLEGYVVLAAELLAIRLLIPFAGSGTETVSIVISAVLLPLAVGYHAGGGAFARQRRKARKAGAPPPSVRAILLKNIVSSLFVLTLGLSYPFLELFFDALNQLGLTHRLAQTALYSLMFLVYPVFLLGQTVPLISHYFSRARLSEVTGRMLFFSTTGSFLGSVFSTLILMTYLGVHLTVIVTLSLLCALALLLTRRLLSFEAAAALLALALAVGLNHPALLRSLRIVSNNQYNTISIVEQPDEEARILSINRSASSKIAADPGRAFGYVRYIEDTFIRTLPESGGPKDVLIIGAGGFTMGLSDTRNHFTYVDIDPAMQRAAEEHFLKQKLGPNKRFVPASARAFLTADTARYDLIVVDTYTNAIAVPMECTTREFLQAVKDRLKPGGALAVNMIASPNFSDRFTVRYHNTFAAVFPAFTRQLIEDFDPWAGHGQGYRHALYLYFHRPETADTGLYTDDKNTYSLDR